MKKKEKEEIFQKIIKNKDSKEDFKNLNKKFEENKIGLEIFEVLI
jgi:hypothetical protein